MTYHQVLLLENDYDENINTGTHKTTHRSNIDPSSIVAVDSQIKQLWGEMSTLRQNTTIRDQIKELELVRLIEVHNKLDIEEQRGLELYTKSFIESLKLYELGVHASIQGGVKCSIRNPSAQHTQQTSTQEDTTSPIANPFYNSNQQALNQIDATRNEIVTQRKAEITQTLIELNRRDYLTPEDEQLKDSLMEEFKSLQ